MPSIREKLFALRDEKYKNFQGALIPTVPSERMIGVRTPLLRALAKEISDTEEAAAFLADLPHRYFDEDQLHAFLISRIKDFDRCLAELIRFLPFVDNWATCDQMNPVAFRKNPERLLPLVREWLADERTYVLRFAIKVLMDHFLGDRFDPDYLMWVAAVRSDEYYVDMMVAWYFATALAKRYEETIPYLEEGRLPSETTRKAIRKALESYRITPDRKEFIKRLKVK